MAAPTTGEILKDAGFKKWWEKEHSGLNWETQVGRAQRNWLADYEQYLTSLGIYPPWKTTEPTPEPKPTPEGYTPEQIAEYEAYLAALEQYPDSGLPVPKDIDDYFENKDKWLEEYVPPTPEPTPEEEEREYTDEEKREYYTYRNYASSYGDPNDWYPLNIEDYFKNWNIAQEQLGEWHSEELEREGEQAEYEREREEAEQWGLSPEESARRREESYEYSQWLRERSREAAEHELGPEEAARRREESYEYSLWSKERAKYGALEAYRETPEYGQTFSSWFSSEASKSQPLQAFIEGMFGKLRTEYQAGLPRLTGFPTREEARAEAGKREAGFEAWLPKQLPGLEEKFWEQPPWKREERPGLFAPRIRSVAL